MKLGDLRKAQALVKSDRAGVRRVDGANHDVLAKVQREWKQCLHQLCADATATRIDMHVHRVLDAESIAAPGAAPVREGRIAEDFFLFGSD